VQRGLRADGGLVRRACRDELLSSAGGPSATERVWGLSRLPPARASPECIPHQKPGLGITRRVPMTPELYEALRKVPRGGPDDRVFFRVWRQRGYPEPVTEMTLRGWVERAQKHVGVKRLGKHGLRHTFCSHLAMAGVPARRIQALASSPHGAPPRDLMDRQARRNGFTRWPQ